MNNKVVGKKVSSNRFLLLLIALMILLVGYPYFQDTTLGSFLGGLVSIALFIFGIYAVQPHRRSFIVAVALAVLAAVSSIIAMTRGVRGHPVVEGAFLLFDAFITVVIFFEVIRMKRIGRDTIFGIVCVYLLVGVTFGTLYDLLETLVPGSFQVNISARALEYIGWRSLVFFSFMTLTTIGYGDITPVTFQAQSLATIEGVIGVLYVAVLIARIVGIYGQRKMRYDDPGDSGEELIASIDEDKKAP